MQSSETKIIKPTGFTTMSNHYLFNKNLSNQAKGLLSIVLALPSDWEYSINGLASLSKNGKDAIIAQLKELKREGYFYSESIREAGKFKTKYYFANTPELLQKELSNNN